MNRLTLCASALLALALTLAACDSAGPEHSFADGLTADARPLARHFVAPMSGDQEVADVETRARGNAVFRLSADGTELYYKLIVANIADVTQAHIHLAPAGSDGPVVAFLYGFALIEGTTSGILAEGTITEANLIARPAIGFGATMEELLHAMRTGGAYVNVHTLAYPPGEIRGQIKAAGPPSK